MGKGEGKGSGKGGATWSCAAVREDCSEIMSSGPACFLYGILALGAVIMGIVLWACSVKTVDSQENAIAYDAVWCKLQEQVLEEGMHGIPPFGQLIVWPAIYKTMNQQVSCNSLDGVEITVEMSFQYQPKSTALYELTRLYKDYDGYQKVLRWRARSAVRHACAKYTCQEFQTMRPYVNDEMQKQVETELSKAIYPENNDDAEVTYGDFDGSMATLVSDLQLIYVWRPDVYEEAVTSKENARNDIALAEAERDQAITQAQTVQLEAYTEANRTINGAQTEATVIKQFAASNASAITEQYAAWTELYTAVKQAHGFTTDALLAYIGNRLMAELPSVTLNLESPAYVSFKDSLLTVPSPSSAPTSTMPSASAAPSAVPIPAPSAMPSATPTPAPIV